MNYIYIAYGLYNDASIQIKTGGNLFSAILVLKIETFVIDTAFFFKFCTYLVYIFVDDVRK